MPVEENLATLSDDRKGIPILSQFIKFYLLIFHDWLTFYRQNIEWIAKICSRLGARFKETIGKSIIR